MNINEVLDEYDAMFGKYNTDKIEGFLDKKLKEAIGEDDIPSVITLLNELIGFCRDCGNQEKGIHYCTQVVRIMNDIGMCNTVEFATTLINVANAYRAFGLYEESQKNYKIALKVFEDSLDAYDSRFAILYNNFSLLYQETGDFELSKDLLIKALHVLSKHPQMYIEEATTQTNLGVTLIRLGKIQDALLYLKAATKLFEKDGGKNYHYSGTLSAMGDAMFYLDRYTEACTYFKKAMELIEKHVGKSANYMRIKEKYQEAEDKIIKENQEIAIKHTMYTQALNKCYDFYTNKIAPMITDKFPEYEGRIAVGVVGEGSDCYGYDDLFSFDHDNNVRLFLWLTKEDVGIYGKNLQKEYEKALFEFYSEQNISLNFVQNQSSIGGVYEINTFYFDLLETNYIPNADEQWMSVKEENLSKACNGKVFRDDLGSFLTIRNHLSSYYPKKVWLYRIAKKLHEYSQSAQYNYSRMMARKDYVTAKLAMSDGIKNGMALVYLINRTYAPYYKWMRRGIKDMKKLPEIGDIMDAICDMEDQRKAWEGVRYTTKGVNGADSIALSFEIIATLILNELKGNGFVKTDETYLDTHVNELIALGDGSNKELLTNNIIKLEWEQFDKVENKGGRADCQDDFNTFSIMRKSQYLAWDEDLLESYLDDIKTAMSNGWNLIMEKYARMMESTSPEEYEEIKGVLPFRSDSRRQIEEAIIEIQVKWMEEFAQNYPKMANNSRSIHTKEDSINNTSYETYLRGELGSYSDITLKMYGRFITRLLDENKNLAYIIMSNTAKLYGYISIDEAEAKIKL